MNSAYLFMTGSKESMMKAGKAFLCVLTSMGIQTVSMAQSVTTTAPMPQPTASRNATGAEFARDFRGSVVYQGTYTGEVTTSNRKFLHSQPAEGAFTMTITVDGAAVTARVETTGNLRLTTPLSGVVNNGVCKLYNPDLLEGQCDLKTFNAVTSFSRGNKSGQFHLDGTAVSVEDFVVRDARRAAQAEEARKQEAAAREEELAARAKMRASLPPGAVAKYKPLLDRAVVADAAHWFSNRYADGSIDLVDVTKDAPTGTMFLKAYFQYVGGREGWVGAIVKEGQVQCLQFWDDSSGCHRIGNGANAKMAAGFFNRMIGGGGGGSSINERGEERERQDRALEQQMWLDYYQRQQGH